jgi:dienelactone hydrolase
MALLSLSTATLASVPPDKLPASQGIGESRARAFAEALIANRIRDSRRDFSRELLSALPEAQLTGLMRTLTGKLGVLARLGESRRGCLEDHPAVWQRLGFERGDLDLRLSFDRAGKIAGVWIVPPEDATRCSAGSESNPTRSPTPGTAQESSDHLQSAPPAGSIETTLQVGAEGWPLQGLLLMPAGRGPFPMVVLVHGSGPHDADETIFMNKPFRDLAFGLARRGIASLRYVKRTRAHAERFAEELPEFTVHDEVIADAVAAVAVARAQPDIDAARTYVIGHSLGAMLAPCIALAEPQVAGLILLAAPSRPLEDVVMDQLDYLSGSEADQTEWRLRASRVKALANRSTVDGPLLLDLPASNWRSLQACDPMTTARQVDKPILILHGERDYQVTMTDFDGWRDGMRDHKSVTLRSFPALNHLFIAGEGRSMPDDYKRAGKMDEAVISTIAHWIASLDKAGP